MKQTVLAIASLLTVNIGVSEAQAATVASDFVTSNTPNNLSVKQQRAIFAFSRDRASLTIELIERWPTASSEERRALAKAFIDAFYAAVASHPDADAVASEIGPSLLMADTLGNAKYLLAEKGSFSPVALDKLLEEVKASLMRTCYEDRNEIVIPYVPGKIAWGQHGQHFPRSSNTGPRKPPTRPNNPRR